MWKVAPKLISKMATADQVPIKQQSLNEELSLPELMKSSTPVYK